MPWSRPCSPSASQSPAIGNEPPQPPPPARPQSRDRSSSLYVDAAETDALDYEEEYDKVLSSDDSGDEAYDPFSVLVSE